MRRLGPTRVRLALVSAVAFGLVASVAALAFWFVFESLEYGVVDGTLDSQARSVLSGLEDQNGAVALPGPDSLPGETSQGIAVAAVLVGPGHKVLDSNLQAPALPLAAAASLNGKTARLDLNLGGGPYRVLSQPVVFAGGTRGAVVLARPIHELDQALLRVGFLLAAVVVGMVAAVSALAYWMAGRALHPVRVMSATARDISEHDLHRRIDLALPAGDELGELAATFNAMLVRLDSAFETLRRFTADAAHELRGPVAMIRSEGEVTLRRRRTADEYEAAIQAMLGEAERLSRTADQLLLLARADEGTLASTFRPVELSDLVEETVERWRRAARQKGVALTVEAGSEGVLEGDPDLLRRLLENLLDNALRHTPPAGRITVSLSRADGRWELRVRDTGPGVEPLIKPLLFHRFTRGDKARGRDTGGAGLGLALCEAIASVHGGEIRLEDTPSGASFAVRLPAGPDRRPAPALAGAGQG